MDVGCTVLRVFFLGVDVDGNGLTPDKTLLELRNFMRRVYWDGRGMC